MYGPNNIGGTINLVSKRPDKPLSIDLGGGIVANQDDLFASNGSAQIGSRINDLWYVTAGMAVNNSSSFPLSGNFAAVPVQPSGDRSHDASHADNYNVKVGFTPNATDEYALGISTVNSTKQDPPYTGNTAVTGQRVAYWDWCDVFRSLRRWLPRCPAFTGRDFLISTASSAG
jgi:iron complex outermembrane receptor protein